MRTQSYFRLLSTIPSRVSSGECFGLAVTVRTEHPQVFSPVIVGYAVDVVEVQRQFFFEPVRQTALIAGILQNTRLEKDAPHACTAAKRRDFFAAKGMRLLL
jgi:hypothetical protein